MKKKILLLLIIATMLTSCTWQSGLSLYKERENITNMVMGSDFVYKALQDRYETVPKFTDILMDRLIRDAGFSAENFTLVFLDSDKNEKSLLAQDLDPDSTYRLVIKRTITDRNDPILPKPIYPPYHKVLETKYYTDESFTIPLKLNLTIDELRVITDEQHKKNLEAAGDPIDNYKAGIEEAYSVGADGKKLSDNLLGLNKELSIDVTLGIQVRITNYNPKTVMSYTLKNSGVGTGKCLDSEKPFQSDIIVEKVIVVDTVLETADGKTNDPLDTTVKMVFKNPDPSKPGLDELTVSNLHIKLETEVKMNPVELNKVIEFTDIKTPNATPTDEQWQKFASDAINKFNKFTLPMQTVQDIMKLIRFKEFSTPRVVDFKDLKIDALFKAPGKEFTINMANNVANSYYYDTGAKDHQKIRVPFLSQISVIKVPRAIYNFMVKGSDFPEFDAFMKRTLNAISY